MHGQLKTELWGDSNARGLLEDDGLYIASAALPVDEIYPGLQTQITIIDGRVRPQYCGAVCADDELTTAAGRLFLQSMYRLGILPGNAGVYRDPYAGTVESLASPQAKHTFARYFQPDSCVGFFHFVKGDLEPAMDGAPYAGTTRESLRVVRRIGITAADLSGLLGADGIYGLADPIDRPELRASFRENGLRMNG